MNSNIFLGSFFVYLLAMIALGWWVSRHHRSTGDDFLLGGRSIPLFLTIGTTIATMVGTGSSMGAVGFGYNNGWAGALYGIGGAIGILLLAVLFASVRKLRFMTMSEELAYYVGGSRVVRNVVALLIYIASIGWLGAHILGGGMYLAWITDIDLNTAKFVVAIGFGLYCVIGGYLAVVWTDTIQAILLFIGFIAMAVFALIEIGGFEHLADNMDASTSGFLGISSLGLIPAISSPPWSPSACWQRRPSASASTRRIRWPASANPSSLPGCCTWVSPSFRRSSAWPRTPSRRIWKTAIMRSRSWPPRYCHSGWACW